MNLDDIQTIKLEKDFKDSERFLDYYNFMRKAWEELDPENAETSFENFRNEWMAYENDNYVSLAYALRYKDRFIGDFWLKGVKQSCSEATQAEKENAFFQCFVQKELRRQGIGKMQLKKVVNLANDLGFKNINFTWCDKEPVKEFCRHFDGILRAKDIKRVFIVKDAVWDKITYFAKPSIRNPEFTIEFMLGYPQEGREDFVRFYSSFLCEYSSFANDESWDLDFVTKEILGGIEKIPHTETRIFAIAKNQEGRFAGITRIDIDNASPNKGFQQITGVAKDFRGNGLGLRLKAEMALYIRDNFPKVEKITTTTSNENKWMIAINEAMGFKITSQKEQYRFDVAKLLKKLGEYNETR